MQRGDMLRRGAGSRSDSAPAWTLREARPDWVQVRSRPRTAAMLANLSAAESRLDAATADLQAGFKAGDHAPIPKVVGASVEVTIAELAGVVHDEDPACVRRLIGDANMARTSAKAVVLCRGELGAGHPPAEASARSRSWVRQALIGGLANRLCDPQEVSLVDELLDDEADRRPRDDRPYSYRFWTQYLTDAIDASDPRRLLVERLTARS